jgi:hypothetical protein
VEPFRGERALEHAWCGVSNPTNCVPPFLAERRGHDGASGRRQWESWATYFVTIDESLAAKDRGVLALSSR